jgi:hypothetical protein
MDAEHKPDLAEHIDSLINYIQQQLRAGLQPNEIAAQLRQAGWLNEHINQAFQQVQAQIMPNPIVNHSVNSNAEQPAATVSNYEQPIRKPQFTTQKRGRIKTGWLLFRQSLRVLRNNKGLTRYAFVSAIVSLGLIIVFSLFFVVGRNTFITASSLNNTSNNNVSLTPVGYIVALIYYVLAFFVVNIYSAGLAANVLDLFNGNSQPYKQYMKKAWSRAGTIFVFSALEATVGLILRAIIERSKLLGRIVAWILGALWSISRLFVIPIIITSNQNAFGAIKQSILLLKSTWGENIVGRVSLWLKSIFSLHTSVIPALDRAYSGGSTCRWSNRCNCCYYFGNSTVCGIQHSYHSCINCPEHSSVLLCPI